MDAGYSIATTERAVKKLDLDAMYANGVTCKPLNGCRILAYMENDRDAIKMGLALCVDCDEDKPRIVRIPNTLHLEHIMLSEAYYTEIQNDARFAIESEPEPFDCDGNIELM